MEASGTDHNNNNSVGDQIAGTGTSSSSAEAPSIAVESEICGTGAADFYCGWLNVWAIDGLRSTNDIFNESAPSPYYPEWEPLFVVFSTKTGHLSHFLTEQYAEEFYRFTDNVSLLSLTRQQQQQQESQQQQEGDGAASAVLRPAVTRRLDGGRAAFMARWGLESLENLRTRFGASLAPATNNGGQHERAIDTDDYDNDTDNNYDNCDVSLRSSNLFLSAKSERIRLPYNTNETGDDFTTAEDNLKSPSTAGAAGNVAPSFYVGSPLTSTAQKSSHERPLSVLRRDISCSMDVLYFKSLQAGNDQPPLGGRPGNTNTLGKLVTPARTADRDQPHVRRPSFRHLKAFLNQHSLTASRHGSTTNTSETGTTGWGPFSGLKIRRAKSQAKLQQTSASSSNNPNSSIHCISSSVAFGPSSSTTPDRWRQPNANSTTLEGVNNAPSRPTSSLFGSQLTMTTIDMNDPDSVHVRPVHPTLLSGHCFQINSTNSPQTHFYACKSPAEGRAWLWELSNYSLASMPYHSPSPTVPTLSTSGSAFNGFNNNNGQQQRTSDSALQQSILSTKSATTQRSYPVANGRSRLVNTLKLSVLEAVNLPQKYKYYCDIYIDDILYARTTSKHRHELLFWGENFEFAQLPAVQCVQLKLYREAASSTKKRSGKEKNSLLGSVSVPIADISGRQLIDRWYPISVESKIRRRIFGQRNSTVVNVRIRGRYQSTVVLPQPNYRDLINFVTANYSWMVESLEPAIPLRLKEELASCMIHILQSRGLVVDFLVSAALAEVARTSSDNEALAFRGNSIASKAFECYMKLVGERYLFDLLSGFVQAVGRSAEDCEVDPAKLQSSSSNNGSDSSSNSTATRNLDRNRFNLVSYCEMVWRKVLQSSAWFPPELRAVFTEIRHNLSSKPMLCDNIISSCVFLRFLCPAILSPSLFGLCQEYPEERASRTFTLVAKTIQSLANFARFGTKEDYMSFMNSFVEREAGNVRQFLVNISSQQQEQIPNAFSLNNGPFIDTAYHSSLLHDVLCECVAFLPKLAPSRGDRHDSPRSDESDLTRHLELQAILDRLTEDLGSVSLHQGAFGISSTQTLPSAGRPQIPSIVAYDNLVCFGANGAVGSNSVARDALFNTFPYKMPQQQQPANNNTQHQQQHQQQMNGSSKPTFIQPATMVPAHPIALRSKSAAATGGGVTVSVVTAPAPLTSNNAVISSSGLAAVNNNGNENGARGVQQQQPGSSCTLSPSVYRRHHGSASKSNGSADRTSTVVGRSGHSPSVWQTLPQQAPFANNNNNNGRQGHYSSGSPERELEKSWNQLIAAAEMLTVDSTSLQTSKLNGGQTGGYSAMSQSSTAPRPGQKQPKMGTGIGNGNGNGNGNGVVDHHSPTTRFSTLTSGYQSSSLSSSNSNSPIQTCEYSASKKKQQQMAAGATSTATPDYSIVSAHEIFPSATASASLPNRSAHHHNNNSTKMAIEQLDTPVGLNLEDSGNDDVFHHHMSTGLMHSPLINSAEMSRLIGPCDVGDESSGMANNDQLLMVNNNNNNINNNSVKRSVVSSSSTSSASSSSHRGVNGDAAAAAMMAKPLAVNGGGARLSNGSSSDGDGSEVSSVLDNLASLEAQLKQEHAALSKSAADRQWLLENGQRCVGNLLDALTKLRKHCEQISTIEQDPNASMMTTRSVSAAANGGSPPRQGQAASNHPHHNHQSPPSNNVQFTTQRPAQLTLAPSPAGSGANRKESHL